MAATTLMVGGIKFGYAHVKTDIKRNEWPVDEAQAGIVRGIFDAYLAGQGYKAIANSLTRRGTPAPKSRAVGWSPSAVRELLTRKAYIGVLEYKKTRKRNEQGQKFKAQRPDCKGRRAQPRPESEWNIVERPDLRLVSDEVWNRLQTRRKEMADKTTRIAGKLVGRRLAWCRTIYCRAWPPAASAVVAWSSRPVRGRVADSRSTCAVAAG